MKRNKLFLLGLFVVFAAVLSLSLVSSTFAKYTSSNNGFDSARVAKWGVEVTASSDYFVTAYDGTVQSSDSVDVLAPGTTKEAAAISITGQPEVSVRITASATVELENWSDENGNFYCPLTFTVAGTSVDLTGLTNADAVEAALETAIINALKVDSAAAGTDLAKTVNVSWSWPFSTNPVNDVHDTFLGDQAAAGAAPTISIGVACTVEQID